MSGKVFINYRREDTAQAAGRIYDRLAQAFGREAIFMDIDKIPYGNDFTTHIRDQFNSCKIVVALIGPKWLSARRGWRFFSKRRIDESVDWVRTELELALSKSTPIIPVLVDGAQMPSPNKLPASISALASRNALGVRHEHFLSDVDALVGSIGNALDSAAGSAQATPFGLASTNVPMRREAIDQRYRQKTIPEYGVRLLPSLGDEVAEFLGPAERPYVMIADYEESRGRTLKALIDSLFIGAHFDAVNASRMQWTAVIYPIGTVNSRAYDVVPATWKAAYRLCTDPKRLALWEAAPDERSEIEAPDRDYWTGDERLWEQRLINTLNRLIGTEIAFNRYSAKPWRNANDALTGLFGMHGCFGGNARGANGLRIFLQRNMRLSELEYKVVRLGTLQDNRTLA